MQLPTTGARSALVLEDAKRFAALVDGTSMPTKAALSTKASDKRVAMRTLLEMRDPRMILAESGYGRGFER